MSHNIGDIIQYRHGNQSSMKDMTFTIGLVIEKGLYYNRMVRRRDRDIGEGNLSDNGIQLFSVNITEGYNDTNGNEATSDRL